MSAYTPKLLCVCAWCRAVIAVSGFSWTADCADVTHGLCDRCMKKLERRSLPPSHHIADLRVSSDRVVP